MGVTEGSPGFDSVLIGVFGLTGMASGPPSCFIRGFLIGAAVAVDVGLDGCGGNT